MDEILPFVGAKDCTGIQLILITGIYGYVLFSAAGMIGDGSELLLLVPAYADLVGTIVLPILGAVPDGMMVLCSGLGPRMEAQVQVSVGVGALAGSTVMLLTIAWFCGVLGGRVSLNAKGEPKYSGKPKLSPPGSMDLFGTGVGLGSKIKRNSYVMMLTACLFLFVQIPAFMTPDIDTLLKESDKTKESVMDLMADQVNKPALIGMVACIVSFFVYLYLQTLPPAPEDAAASGKKIANLRMDAIRNGALTLRGAMGTLYKEKSVTNGKGEPLLFGGSEKEKQQLQEVLKPFFAYYDSDKNNLLSRVEFGKIMSDLRENLPIQLEDELFAAADVDASGTIDFQEFVALMLGYLRSADWRSQGNMRNKPVEALPAVGGEEEEGDEEEEEEEEMPEDLQGLSPEQQQLALKLRSLYIMGTGTIFVLVFSDPMVDVLNEIGKRTGIPAFYISFVLAPLASNASELLATYNYATKKTLSSMTISLSLLEGAACMNNTFCLSIFYGLIFMQRLTWSFTAEVGSILIVQFIMGAYAMKSVHTMFDAFCILSLFPGSLIFVWVCNNILHIP